MRIVKMGALAAVCATSLSCGDDDGGSGPGSLRIQLSAEETISDGLRPGADEENTVDNTTVSYSKYLVAIGRVKLGRTSSGESREDPNVYIADMRSIGEQGVELFKLDGLASGQWDQFGYETPAAPTNAIVQPGVSPADGQAMIAQQLTYWVEGTVQREGRSVRFSFQVAAPTVFSACQSDGEPGVTVSEGGQSTAAITLHGDHLWFDSLPTGSEGTVMRRAEWVLAAADRLGKTELVTADLANVPAEQVFPSSLGYNLAGANIGTALDFVRAQLSTQGHLNGEGECSWDPAP